MTEREFKKTIKNKIKEKFPNAIILQNDPNYIQGIPDMIVLIGKIWAALEFKKSKDSKHRPNQDHYIQKMNEMSFASFIYPENANKVIIDLQDFVNSHKIQRL